MNRLKQYISLLLLLLMAGCSNDDPMEMTPADDVWTPLLTRSETGGENVLVSLKWNGTHHYGTLIPGDSETSSSWVNGNAPQWPEDESTEVEVIALMPAADALPTEMIDDGPAYRIYYSKAEKDNKPSSFTMNHLLAQLRVRILIRETQNHAPTDASISLKRKGNLSFADKAWLDPATVDAEKIPLGTFFTPEETEEAVSTATGEAIDFYFECAPRTVIPQTLPAGEICLRFNVENVAYVFRPSRDIQLLPGKLNILNLGITYTEPEDDSNTGTGGAIPAVEVEGITVTDWTENTINIGEIEEIEQ